MNTEEIDHVLRSDSYSHLYGGIFPIDKLPKVLDSKHAYVVNLDTSKEEGSHWVGVQTFGAPHMTTYFDPFGISPPVEIIPNLLSVGKDIYYADIAVQSVLSQYCGYHVLMVSLLMQRGITLQDILSRGYQAQDEQYLRNDFTAAIVIHAVTDLKSRPVINWSQLFS